LESTDFSRNRYPEYYDLGFNNAVDENNDNQFFFDDYKNKEQTTPEFGNLQIEESSLV